MQQMWTVIEDDGPNHLGVSAARQTSKPGKQLDARTGRGGACLACEHSRVSPSLAPCPHLPPLILLPPLCLMPPPPKRWHAGRVGRVDHLFSTEMMMLLRKRMYAGYDGCLDGRVQGAFLS